MTPKMNFWSKDSSKSYESMFIEVTESSVLQLWAQFSSLLFSDQPCRCQCFPWPTLM